MTVKITINNHTILRIIGVIITSFLALLAVYYTRSALTLIAISIFLAMALNPPVSYLAERLPGNSRGIATAISYLAVIGLITSIAYATIPPLVSQSNQFVRELPGYIEEIKNGEEDDFVSQTVERFGLEERLSDLQDNISADNLTGAGGPVISFFQRLSSSAISVLTVLVLTFFMLVEGPAWLEKMWALHPREHRKHRKELANKMYRIVTGYVNGQLLVAAIAAMTALTMMSILTFFDINIPFIIPMSAIVGLFSLIPLIGATISAVLVVGVSLFESVVAAIIMAIFFVVYQQVENNAIQPIIQSKTVNLTPLSIFIAAIIGVNLAGILGAIVAIPVAASIRIVAKDYIERHHIGGSKPKKKTKATAKKKPAKKKS